MDARLTRERNVARDARQISLEHFREIDLLVFDMVHGPARSDRLLEWQVLSVWRETPQRFEVADFESLVDVFDLESCPARVSHELNRFLCRQTILARVRPS